jgi:hypothetical protein
MSKAYVSNITKSTVVTGSITAAKVNVPRGKYIISGKLFISAHSQKDIVLVHQIIGATLSCGKAEDVVSLRIFPRNPDYSELSTYIRRFLDDDPERDRFYPLAGQDVVIPFHLAVDLIQSESIELSVISGNSGGIIVQSAHITALEVDELTIHTEIPNDTDLESMRFKSDRLKAILFDNKQNNLVLNRRIGIIRRIFHWLFG